MRLVESLKAAAKSDGKAVYAWDTKLKGFGVRVSPGGQVSWLVQKWQGGKGGKSKRVVIGHLSFMPLDKARAEAGSKAGDVFNGIDLVDRRAKARIAKRKQLHAPTIGAAFDLYYKRNAEPGSYWTEVKHRFERTFIPALGRDTKIAEIDKADVRALLDTLEDRGHAGAARYAFTLLRPFFKWCVGRDIISVSPIDSLAAPSPSKPRDRILTDEEIKAFWSATCRLPPIQIGSTRDQTATHLDLWRPFYQLLLLTAQRRDEVAGMRRSEIDWSNATWTIPGERTKNGEQHIVHLPPLAIEILEGLPTLNSDLFFTTTLETPISGYGKAKARLDTLMAEDLEGILPWRVHDLRRTAASGMARLGFLPHVVERVLNHLSGARGGLVGVYQRYEYLPERKKALEAWSSFVSNLVAETPMNANVVSFTK